LAFNGVDTSVLLHQAMRTAALNHKLIANNIANADTPNYTPVRLDFQATLRNALEGRDGVHLRRTHTRHLEGGRRFRPVLDKPVLAAKNDHNKVDLEEEMDSLSRNTGKYNMYASLLGKEFREMTDMLQRAR